MSWEHFTLEEMRCKHTGECRMDEEFMRRLETLRLAFAKPMPVSSGYRHPTHPIEARKRAPGPHTTGKAVDVKVHGGDAHRLLALALKHGFTGIGVNQRSNVPHDERFLHLDTLTPEEALRPWLWSY